MRIRRLHVLLAVIWASTVGACSDHSSTRLSDVSGYGLPILGYAQVVRAQWYNPPTKFQGIQTLKLESASDRHVGSTIYGFAVMFPDRPINKAFCEALVSNLTFFSEQTRSALVAGDPNSVFYDTVLYDVRSSDALKKISRPEYLTKSDCDEIVSNFAYTAAFIKAVRLGIKPVARGPYLVAVDPVGQWVLIYDLSEEKDLDVAIDKWTEMLQDNNAWRDHGFSFWDYVLTYFGKNPPVRVIRLPKDL